MNKTQGTGRIVAVLGPTNTGKTYLALERMIGHRSGMIGFPLRLLARENYDRIVRVKGAGAVALLTGEEKIVPAHPSWYVCTVEAMPTDRRVDFLAIDEIQLCADAERGHVFTDRLLHARGETETMFLGAETIKPLLRRLVPEAEFLTRPRLSQLSYGGPRKLTRLPPRSAVVAFSAADVYGLAEMVRRQRGGAAVVLGALSPRARNAQVALYQAGEVDYLVATDAIGMGLNMDIDHVAFAALRKFDGRVPRPLEAAELAQIAGRAGRHMNDGTFGTTGDLDGLDPKLVEAVENHRFPPLKRLWWRNSDLRFTSLDALAASLDRLPDRPGLVRAREADDHLALAALRRDATIAERAVGPDMVKLLWQVCQIPDFRKGLAESHSRLLAAIFRHLSGPTGRLPSDWLDAQVKRVDRTDGDIETLMTRIANVRTWTYVSQRGDWVADAGHWQARTKALEDRLSDALHERLTQRFVDQRTAVLVRKLKSADALQSAVEGDGAVRVEGQFVGTLKGLRFQADEAESGNAARAVSAAAVRALRGEIASRLAAMNDEADDAFRLDGQGYIAWRDAPVARLAAGAEPLRPAVEVLPSDLIEGPSRTALQRRLARWLDAHLERVLTPLFALRRAALSGAARGLAFHLGETLGSAAATAVAGQTAALTVEDRRTLSRLGVRFGCESVFMPALLKPAAQRLRAALWCCHAGSPPLPPPQAGRVWVPATLPEAFYEAVGYRPLAGLAIRVDMLERFAADARALAREGPFQATPALDAVLGTPAGRILEALGYQARPHPELGVTYQPRRRPPARPRRRRPASETSPFAVLRARVPKE